MKLTKYLNSYNLNPEDGCECCGGESKKFTNDEEYYEPITMEDLNDFEADIIEQLAIIKELKGKLSNE